MAIISYNAFCQRRRILVIITMYPSPLAKSTVTYYCDIWRIKEPIHIVTCSSCTCAPLYANILSFNSQPVLLKGFGSFTTVTFLPTLLTGTFVLKSLYLAWPDCISSRLFISDQPISTYISSYKININRASDILFGQDIAFLHFFHAG